MKSKIFSVRPRSIVRRRISVMLLAVLLVVVLWGASAPLFSCTVYALPPALLKARTIGELIVTLFAGAGTAVTNPTVVPAIYSNYDTSAYSFETLIDEGILQPVDQSLTTEQAVELLGSGNGLQTPYNLDTEAFRTYVSTNWTQMQDLGVDAVLRLNNIANTDSVYGAIDNLGQLVKDVANYGYLGSSNAIAVVTNPGTVVQVAWQNILDAIKSRFGTSIENGILIDIKYYEGYNNIGFNYTKVNNQNIYYNNNYYCEVPCYVAYYGTYNEEGKNGIVFMPKQVQENTFEYGISTNGGDLQVSFVQAGQNITSLYNNRILINCGNPIFASETQAKNYLNGLKNGTVQPIEQVSPDMINQNQGNINELPVVNPAVPAGKGLEIIDGDTYNNYVNTANNNYHTGVPESNAEVTDDLINNHLVDDTSQEIPQEPWENPDIPGTNPINPSQPDLPDKPTLTPEEEIAALTPNAEGIISVFPFCIPWDIYAFVKEFNIPRKAPVIHAEIPIPFGGTYIIDLDLSIYDDVAEVCRILILILFIIGLAVASRGLIGA